MKRADFAVGIYILTAFGMLIINIPSVLLEIGRAHV